MKSTKEQGRLSLLASYQLKAAAHTLSQAGFAPEAVKQLEDFAEEIRPPECQLADLERDHETAEIIIFPG